MMESALFESHFDLIPFGIYVVDVRTFTVIYNNQAFRHRFGDHRGAVCYKALYELDEPCPWCRMEELLGPAGQPGERTVVYEHFNEVDDRWYQMQVRTMTWPDGRTVKYSIAVDISSLKDTQNRLAEAHAELALRNRELQHLSCTDVLTGLDNRQHIEALTRQALCTCGSDGKSLSLILFDIDHFKAINDRHGHLVGDAVLHALAGAVRRVVPDGCPVGRWGGEEFLILCPAMAVAEATRLAEGARAAVRAMRLPEVDTVTGSFGVAEARPGDCLEGLLARVDTALYAAKRLGRDRVAKA